MSHITPRIAIALLEGQMGPEERAFWQEHLGGCEACGQEMRRVLEALGVSRRLGPWLRSLCPPEEELVDHVLGLEVSAVVEEHLQWCPLCQDQADDLRSLARPSILRMAIRLVSRGFQVVASDLELAGAPVAAPAFRGSEGEEEAIISATFLGQRAQVTIDGAGGQGADLTVVREPPWLLMIRRGGRIIQMSTPDEGGRAVVDGLGPGVYEVAIRPGEGKESRLVLEIEGE